MPLALTIKHTRRPIHAVNTITHTFGVKYNRHSSIHTCSHFGADAMFLFQVYTFTLVDIVTGITVFMCFKMNIHSRQYSLLFLLYTKYIFVLNYKRRY